jgi:membrane protease YdiL (CAAX protease family)
MKQNITELLLLFIVFYLPGFLWPDQSILKSQEEFGLYMIQFLIMAVPQILLLLYILKLRDTAWAEFGLAAPRWIDIPYSLGIFAGIFIVLAGVGFIVSILPKSGQDLFMAGFRWKLREPLLIPLVVVFCLVTGYREELFFRAYLLTRFSQLALPAGIAVALSTLLFAGGHLYQGWAGPTVAAVQGLYFSFLFLKYKNVHRLAIAHGLYNTAVLLISLFLDGNLPVTP